MAGATKTRSRAPLPGRWAWWGFLLGCFVTVPATVLALVSPVGEALLGFLVPSTELLGPLSEMMASWPGLVTVLVASLVNGLVYAVVAVVLAVVVAGARQR